MRLLYETLKDLRTSITTMLTYRQLVMSLLTLLIVLIALAKMTLGHDPGVVSMVGPDMHAAMHRAEEEQARAAEFRRFAETWLDPNGPVDPEVVLVKSGYAFCTDPDDNDKLYVWMLRRETPGMFITGDDLVNNRGERRVRYHILWDRTVSPIVKWESRLIDVCCTDGALSDCFNVPVTNPQPHLRHINLKDFAAFAKSLTAP